MDNVRSGCYGYAIMVSRGVRVRVFISSRHTFPAYSHTSVGKHSTRSLLGFPTTSNSGRAELRAYAFFMLLTRVIEIFKTF